MTSKLPFVVQPKLQSVIEIIGTDASGRIEVERKGYLTVSEKAFVQAALGGGTAMTKVYSMASRIAAKVGKDPQEVFGDMTNPAGVDYLEPYQDQILEILAEMSDFQEKNRIFTAAALLINRVDQNISIEDVMDLHPDLLEALYELYQEEDAKDVSRLDQAVADEEDEEPAGKSQKAK